MSCFPARVLEVTELSHRRAVSREIVVVNGAPWHGLDGGADPLLYFAVADSQR